MSPGTSELLKKAAGRAGPSEPPSSPDAAGDGDESGDGYSEEQTAAMERVATALGLEKGKAGKLRAAFEEWHELMHMDD